MPADLTALIASNPGAFIDLFTLDTSPISEAYGVAPASAPVLRFTPSTDPLDVTDEVNRDSLVYVAVPVTTTGWEASSEGKQANPKISISNVNHYLLDLVTEYDDLIGAKLTRLRTFVSKLDGYPDEDPTHALVVDTFIVEQLTLMTATTAEFSLRAQLNLDDAKLPARPALRDVCDHRYRVWGGAAFDYANATCPYTADTDTLGEYFDFLNEELAVIDKSKDVCSRNVKACTLRFPDDPLPFRGFPGLGQRR